VSEPALTPTYPPVNEDTQKRAAVALRELLLALGPVPASEDASFEELLAGLGQRLAGPDIPRDARKAEVVDRLERSGKLAHPEARIRAWLWLFDSKDYDDQRRNLVELIEALGKKLVTPHNGKGAAP